MASGMPRVRGDGWADEGVRPYASSGGYMKTWITDRRESRTV